ncbi:MAG: pilus assembly PilX family protein [Thermoanaerobaculia bacterium]
MTKHTSTQRGSALLVSLMVMVGLSLLGLGFVAISETESAISINERNYAETLAVAETGARAVVEMFQDADWADAIDILPPNKTAIKTSRTVSSYTGYYKGSPTDLLFDSPFKPAATDRFFGDEENADVIINASKGSVATDYLDDLNDMLFGADANPRLTEIRIYAPPIVGGTLVGGFWTSGDRFGVATISATAEKTGPNGQPVSRRTVKIVLGETPLPGAAGPIQTEGALDNAGSFEVYWGKVTAVDDLKVIKPAVGLPWFDASESAYFEYGYDSTRPWEPNTGYATVGTIVHPPQSAQNVVPELRRWAYKVTTAGANSGPEPLPTDWPQVLGNTITTGDVTLTTVYASRYPIAPATPYESQEWLWELAGKSVSDPWFQARTRGELCYNNNCTGTPNAPHPYKYNNPAQDETTTYSNFFKYQTHTEPNDRVEVTFPTIDYEFWREIAQSSEPDSGIIYLKWNAATQQFRSLDNVSMTAVEWLNAIDNGYGAGFYFFDSANGLNPQYGLGGTLTPDIIIGSADKGPSGYFQMQGFIYLNAQYFGTGGVGATNPTDVFPMPGEPFRDVGYREVDDSTMTFNLDAAGDFVLVGKSSDQWDFQDLDGDFAFDVVTAQKTVQPPGGGAPVTLWLPVPWFETCTVGTTCSEPHEPYLNLVYPTIDNAEGSVGIGWSAAGNVATMRPKIRLSENTPNSCTNTSTALECTGNWFDETGAVVRINPVLNGILYNEGGYDAQGNAKYYGSLLIRGDFKGNGTPAVYFNECILKNCWQEQLNLPKVMIQSTQTDQ